MLIVWLSYQTQFTFRYSGLTFAYLQLEDYGGWYTNLLRNCSSRDIANISLHNCIGTVLAINGLRKYYYIYHPKKARRWIKQMGGSVSASFGLVDSDSSTDEDDPNAKKILMEELLDGLRDWLDRVFDGSVRRIKLESGWPAIDSPL